MPGYRKIAAKAYIIFILFWLVLNLLQAACTELTSDEGYYWFYSRQLDWGYYDHPPMVALMIRIGTLLFSGPLGVRFMNVSLSTGAMLIFFDLLPEDLKNSKRTFLLILSAPLLNYLAFIVFPDGPLIFFGLLFLVLYKRFIQQNNTGTAVLMGVTIALMMYSKYHGVLILFFTLLANPKLIRNGLFYLALGIAFFLFLPHMWWQYRNNFVTLGYHLSGRTDPVSTKHVFEYVSQQIPAIGIGLVFVPFIYKTKDLFERTLKYIIMGTFVFFLFSSLKTFVHFHWTSIAIYPIVFFAVKYYQGQKRKRLFNTLIIPFAVIMLLVRLQLMITFLPLNHANVDYYKGRSLWAEDISNIAGNRPVFFPDNLREASLYSYYSGKTGVTFYGREEKKSQYDLRNYEDSIQGKEVLFAAPYPYPGGKRLDTRMGQTIYYSVVSSFRSYYDKVPLDAAINKTDDSTFRAIVEIKNERNYNLSFDRNKNGAPPVLIYSIEKDAQAIRSDTLKILSKDDDLLPGESRKYAFPIPVKSLVADNYNLLIGFRFDILPEAFNSRVLPLSINKK